jgi:hypothetical protein
MKEFIFGERMTKESLINITRSNGDYSMSSTFNGSLLKIIEEPNKFAKEIIKIVEDK